MSDSLHPLVVELGRMQRNLQALTNRAGEIQRQLALLDPPRPGRFVCETCDGLVFRSAEKLAEHAYHQHDGPNPPHWANAEKLAEADP